MKTRRELSDAQSSLINVGRFGFPVMTALHLAPTVRRGARSGHSEKALRPGEVDPAGPLFTSARIP